QATGHAFERAVDEVLAAVATGTTPATLVEGAAQALTGQVDMAPADVPPGTQAAASSLDVAEPFVGSQTPAEAATSRLDRGAGPWVALAGIFAGIGGLVLGRRGKKRRKPS